MPGAADNYLTGSSQLLRSFARLGNASSRPGYGYLELAMLARAGRVFRPTVYARLVLVGVDGDHHLDRQELLPKVSGGGLS
jgi:hypothetical protein